MAEDATDYGIKYRKQGDSEWIRVAAQTTRAARTEFTVSLTGLEPNTTYEYAAYASGSVSYTHLTLPTSDLV